MSNIKFKYNFFLNRNNITLEQFLSGCMDLDSAKQRIEEYSLFGLTDKNIMLTLQKLNNKKNTDAEDSLDDNKKSTRKKVVKKKTRTRTRARTKRKPTKNQEKNTKSKEEDVSYFETWKVPYVEP